ncbi:MAG TPA: riboflavin synthase [Casimicrobiaceae bacterium]
MFTGIVQAVGRIVSRERGPEGVHIGVDAAALDLRDVAVGDSISVAGCCLTVVDVAAPLLHFDVSDETLACTSAFALDSGVNLECALRLSDRLGGHLMSGHVDGVGEVVRFEPAGDAEVGHRRLEVRVPAPLARYIAPKGSVAIDGVSLTTNTVADSRFTVNLIPHTLAVTTLGTLAPGDRVNIEVDLVARYVERLRGAQ